MAQQRASKGGEIGMNGEFYAGGTFLPNTELGKLPATAKATASRKREIAPYKWEMEPTPTARPIFSMIGFCLTWDVWQKTVKPAGLDAYPGAWGYTAKELADAYNAGERWIEPK